MAKTKKQSLIKDAVTLCLISLIAALALGFVNELTKDRIASLAAEEKAAAYRAVFPGAAGFTEKEENEILAAAMQEADRILTDGGYAGVTLNEVCLATDDKNEVIGYVASVTVKGYDRLTLTFGYTVDGVCMGLEFLELKETPGMGMRANEPEFKGQFAGKQAEAFVGVKGSASAENEIDALSGATMTTNGVVTGINAGICFMRELQGRLGGGR